MAEAVKHGVIADRDYFDALEQEHAAVTARTPERSSACATLGG